MRQCSGCGGHFPKKELLRVVRGVDGTVSLDFTGKKSGRGAYICKDPTCLTKAERNKKISRSLECEIPTAVYAAMREELTAYDGE